MIDLATTFAGVAQGISAQFGGPYHPGAILDDDVTLDDGGSIATPGPVTERACMIQIDSATEAMRQADGYAEGDVRFLVLSATLTGPLGTDARARVNTGPHAGLWSVTGIERDPMAIYWGGRGRRAS